MDKFRLIPFFSLVIVVLGNQGTIAFRPPIVSAESLIEKEESTEKVTEFPLGEACADLVNPGAETDPNHACALNCIFLVTQGVTGGYCNADGMCICTTKATKVSVIPLEPPKCADLVDAYLKDKHKSCLFACLVSGKPGGICTEMEDYCICIETRNSYVVQLNEVKCSELLPVQTTETGTSEKSYSRACSVECFKNKYPGGICVNNNCMCIVSNSTSIGAHDIVSFESLASNRIQAELIKQEGTCTSLAIPPLGLDITSERSDCSRYCVWKGFEGGFCNEDSECFCIRQLSSGETIPKKYVDDIASNDVDSSTVYSDYGEDFLINSTPQ